MGSKYVFDPETEKSVLTFETEEEQEDFQKRSNSTDTPAGLVVGIHTEQEEN